MAVSPLFFDTRDALLDCVRLGDLCTNSEAQHIVDRSMQLAIVTLRNRLGSSLINELQATGYVETPTTDAETKRLSAQLVECSLFQAELLCLLPMMTVDGNGIGLEAYQNESPFRLMGPDERAAKRVELIEHAGYMLTELIGVDVPANQCLELGADYTPPVSGYSSHAAVSAAFLQKWRDEVFGGKFAQL